MGPCPFRHGYAGVPDRWNRKTDASMGPCPFRHGYAISFCNLVDSVLASMGPCPFRHGYLSACGSQCLTALMLQWGHALSGMDIWSEFGCWLQFGQASMGPCPFRHGYPTQLVIGSVTFQLLQWGHALSGMDIFSSSNAETASVPLQWGHALSGMDILCLANYHSNYHQRFNGAMPFQAWIFYWQR